ncbi:MAG: hypothetical protein ACI381_06635 [Candidatus Methanomethylophilaceae archaeon]
MAVTTKTWTGSDTERFTYTDWNRITSNAKSIASAIAFTAPSFSTAYQYSQFDYTEANKLEELLAGMGELLGVEVGPFSRWTVGRAITYVDINRWETACEALDSNASDGRVTLKITATDQTDCEWSIASSDGAIVASGSSMESVMYFRLSPDTYTLTRSLYGDTATNTYTLSTSNLSASLLFCEITVTCDREILAMQYNGSVVSGVSGTTATFSVLRGSSSRLISASVYNESPAYDGVVSDLLYTYAATATVTPSVSSRAISITSSLYGNVVTISRSGKLTIPVSGKFGLFLIGGGAGGSGFGHGGCGGEMVYVQSVQISAGEYDLTMGKGGEFNGGGGDTTFGDMYTAQGGGVINGFWSVDTGHGSGGGGVCNSYYELEEDEDAYRYRNGLDGSFGGGGGAAGGSSSWHTKNKGGTGGTYGGAGGIGGTYVNSTSSLNTDAAAGSSGSVISDPILNGADVSGGSVASVARMGGGGGGGGCGAPGGAGGPGYTQPGGGGGGGGVAGGAGGAGGAGCEDDGDIYAKGGLGYGAGGGGAYGWNGPGYYPQIGGAGGGGGGLGTVKLAQDTQEYVKESAIRYGYPGGAGAPGAIRIRYLGD